MEKDAITVDPSSFLLLVSTLLDLFVIIYDLKQEGAEEGCELFMKDFWKLWRYNESQ